MTKLWLCEKPAQAKLVAARIGTTGRGDGFINTKDGKVTWCIGHLLGLKSPDQLNTKWKKWDMATLPIVPDSFDLEVSKGKEKQARIVGKLLKESNHVVIATDGDREGELLGREMLDYFNWSGKIERMWNSNLDDESIDNALKAIKPGSETQSLYYAAQARSECDYIAGMTLTRAATISYGNGNEVFSVGRVQTAVLGMIVRRELEIDTFKPSPYYELKANFFKDGEKYSLMHSPAEESRILLAANVVDIVAKITGVSGVLDVEQKRKKSAPPKLFSLSTLQQAANKSFGWSASQTKEIAQELYDAQISSYPRTDCQFLPNEQEKDAARVIEQLARNAEFSSITALIDKDNLVFRKSTFNSAKTTAHHAIVPTVACVDVSILSAMQKQLFCLIAVRYLLAFLPDYEYDSTTVKTTVEGYLFSATGAVSIVQGWKAVFNEDKKDENNQVFPPLKTGENVVFSNIETLSKQTKCRPRYTQASILRDMENISKFTDDKEILAVIKSRIKDDANAGIGTPSTRDTFVDILSRRNYITVEKNKIFASKVGIKLICALPGSITDPVETCVMENKLDSVADGSLSKNEFMSLAISHTTGILNFIKEKSHDFSKNEVEHVCPECRSGLVRRKGSNGFFWACSGYPNCKFTTSDGRGKPVFKMVNKSEFECPDCSKPLIFREGKAKKTNKKYSFWGCSGYPICKKSFDDNKGKPVFKTA